MFLALQNVLRFLGMSNIYDKSIFSRNVCSKTGKENTSAVIGKTSCHFWQIFLPNFMTIFGYFSLQLAAFLQFQHICFATTDYLDFVICNLF
jgi:hypothetical protein